MLGRTRFVSMLVSFVACFSGSAFASSDGAARVCWVECADGAQLEHILSDEVSGPKAIEVYKDWLLNQHLLFGLSIEEIGYAQRNGGAHSPQEKTIRTCLKPGSIPDDMTFTGFVQEKLSNVRCANLAPIDT